MDDVCYDCCADRTTADVEFDGTDCATDFDWDTAIADLVEAFNGVQLGALSAAVPVGISRNLLIQFKQEQSRRSVALYRQRVKQAQSLLVAHMKVGRRRHAGKAR